MRGQGGVPLELTEADIAERYGWTFTQLDAEDEDRVYNSFALQNVRDAVDRIKSWLASVGKMRISKHDLSLYGMILDAEKEVYGERKKESSATGIEEYRADFPEDA